jgi:hypothetical protein
LVNSRVCNKKQGIYNEVKGGGLSQRTAKRENSREKTRKFRYILDKE